MSLLDVFVVSIIGIAFGCVLIFGVLPAFGISILEVDIEDSDLNNGVAYPQNNTAHHDNEVSFFKNSIEKYVNESPYKPGFKTLPWFSPWN